MIATVPIAVACASALIVSAPLLVSVAAALPLAEVASWRIASLFDALAKARPSRPTAVAFAPIVSTPVEALVSVTLASPLGTRGVPVALAWADCQMAFWTVAEAEAWLPRACAAALMSSAPLFETSALASPPPLAVAACATPDLIIAEALAVPSATANASA